MCVLIVRVGDKDRDVFAASFAHSPRDALVMSGVHILKGIVILFIEIILFRGIFSATPSALISTEGLWLNMSTGATINSTYI